MGEDEQCAGDLRCSSLRNGVWPTGSKNCNQDGMSDSHWTGYCMPEEDYVPLPTSNISDDWEPESVVPYHGELIIIPECPPEGCPVCSAPMNDGKGCTDDDVCAEGLSCYNRHGETDAGHKQVAGCQGSKVSSYGYCYTKDLAYELPEIPYRTQPPPNNEFVLTNEVQAPEECSIYAVDRDKTIDVPFSGSSGKCFSPCSRCFVARRESPELCFSSYNTSYASFDLVARQRWESTMHCFIKCRTLLLPMQRILLAKSQLTQGAATKMGMAFLTRSLIVRSLRLQRLTRPSILPAMLIM